MSTSFTWSLTFALVFVSGVWAATYTVSDTYTGQDFLNSFTVQNIPDPTNGRVNYVDAATAKNDNLTFASATNFIARADFTTILDPNGPGRNSVRLLSNKQYGLGRTSTICQKDAVPGLLSGLLEIKETIGQLPSVSSLKGDSLYNSPSEQRGSIMLALIKGRFIPVQIVQCPPLEQKQERLSNLIVTLHFGPTFNSNGGGWYAMELTDDFVKIWFWARGTSVPSDVSGGSSTIDTDNWGTPVAYFPNTSCSISSHFGPQNIIINLTFCGDWAGAVYSSSGCPSTCVDYVNNNPAEFENAYFDFLSLKAYT
ncbi:hypothetical protein HHX47_DHR2000957 [Lentinula edodes]|nr:hypothetical protein HHX47_DHR2000957 [Lentinula edodes]